MNAVDYFFEDTAGLEKDLLISAKEHCSYFTMSKDVARLSAWLQSNFKKGSIILLISPNNAFFVKAYLSIMKSGCICVPLNPAIEPFNLSYVQEKTKAVHIFMHTSVIRNISCSLPVTDEKSILPLIEDQNIVDYRPGPEIRSDDVAQIIFTSGSTAVPKGVVITHGNLIANTQSILEYLNLTRYDKMLVVLPFFYCYGLSLLHTHLKVGATLVLNNTFIFLGSVLRDLQHYECTGFAGVPSHFQVLLRKSDSFRNGDFPSLRYVTQAGGKLHKAFISEFMELFPDVRFFVMYGQTEATARLSFLPPENLPQKLGSIGKGIPGVELRVVDDHGHEVLPGEVGEILARGQNIMKGYFEDQISTDMTLRDGWLHTGDLGTVDEDGFIYLSARRKEMIKVGGKRIGPKEIEEVIVAMPGVIDCTVEGYDHPLLGEALRATVVNAPGTTISADDVRAVCAVSLASYKIPSEVVFEEKMVVSATGKKVKGAL